MKAGVGRRVTAAFAGQRTEIRYQRTGLRICNGRLRLSHYLGVAFTN